MTKILKTSIAAVLILSTASAGAFNLKDLLKAAGGTDTTSTSKSSTIGSLLGNLLSSDKITISSMTGTWNYSSPAVTFRSDNLLMKAGGAAASTTIVNKIEPYYRTLGLNTITMTINEDGSFNMNVRKIKLNGTISEAPEKTDGPNFVMTFTALGSRQIGQIDTWVTKNVNGELTVTFDISKLVELVEKVSAITGNQTAQGITSLLSKYDGVCAGFNLKK